MQLKRVTDLKPQSMNPWLQFLGALVQTDREEESDALVRQWLKEASAVAPLANPVHYYRGQAAIYYCFGQRHYLSNNLCDEQWHEPLAEFVLAIASNKGNPDLADQVLGNHLFNQTPQSQRVRLQLFDTLATNVATMEIGWVGKYLEWSLTNTSNLPKERLLKIRDVLLTRWKEECESAIRANRNDSQNLTWANSVLRVLNYADTEGVLPFLRRQLAEGPPPFRQSFAQSLYDHLLSLAWTPETENELFSLLDQTVAASPPAERLRQQIERLHSLTDAMVSRREAIGLAAVENLGTLPRKQQADERQRIRREAQTGFAHRLQVELPRRPADLQLWINLEILHLDVQVGADLADCGGRALALLDQMPVVKQEPQPESQPEPDPARPAPTAAEEARAQADAQEAAQRRQLTRTARLRTLLILSHLACRPKADPKWADELLKFIATAQTAEPANPLWKNLQYQLLVGLDRPLELKTRLAGWVLEEDGERWRLALGYLLAELGDVPAAIGLFEATETADELTPPAYRALSGWYQAAGRRAEYDHARIQIFKTAEEWQMGQMLGQRLQPWQATSGALPSKLNDDVLLLFRALFEKSGSPGTYLGYLQQFYAATHDFRLLSVLADSVIGHSAGKVYPFVQAMQPTLNEIRDEATADELRDQIIAVRKRAKTRVDQRALDLLELQVERRAAEVRNQPGPHIDRAVSALKRALAKTGWVVQDGTESVINLDPDQQPRVRDGWSPGEPRLMADFLASLGKITPQRLADVQIQALTELHGAQRLGSYDRLHIAEQYARVLWSQAAEPWQDKAIELLSAGLREFEQAQGGFLPYSARNAVSTYSSYLRDRRRFIEAERFFDAQLKHPVHGQQEIFFTDRLYEVWLGALTTDSPVSLGKGQELYQAMRGRLITRLETTGDQSQRYNLNSTLCSLYRVAADRKYATVQADCRGYATKIVPELLKTQTSNYTSIVVQVASTLHAVNGPREALAFLMDRTEQSPRWFRFTYNSDIWSNYGSYLTEWRRELGDVGDLSPRLEALFVAELRKDLTTLRGNYRIGYARDADSGRFWKEKTEVFAKVADEVYAKRGAQTEVVEHIARYLWSGLGLEDRAIAMLFDAHGKKVLGENGRSLLVQYLQAKQRFGESVALLEQLIEQNPDHVEYTVSLAYAYFQTQRPNDVARVLAAAETRFRSRKTWGEGVALRLGQSALQTTRYADAVRLLTEAIAMREESRIDRGAQDGSLGTYYTDRALAYAGLGETAKAVDDATSGLVAWGPDARQHGTALSVLKQVLTSSPDLVKYAADLNRETAESKTDRPAVRKALGEVLLDKNQPAAAKEQLLIAWELRPYDADVQRLLVTCLDRLEDPRGAIDRLLQSAQSSRRNYGVYADLGSRYDRLGDAAAAERARTSVLDLLPNDAEGHQNLAQIREGQNRFQDALTEWREVLRLRPMDPNGLFGVIRNQISANDREGAKESLQILKKTNWAQRFREPVQQQVRELEEKISQ
ncbi:MAG: hypothetical protein NT069_07235 [Planctomycetota bacterium]|nr:hypothetical protein [Planctomycetota bacterium]